MNGATDVAPGSRLAARAEAVAPFHVMRLLKRARELEAEGRRILHLEIGEPDFPTPGPVMAEARHAIADNRDRYTPSSGLPALRRDIAGYYQRRYGLSVNPERILITPGASGALQLALLSLLDLGDSALIADPSYPCYAQVTRLIGGRVVAVPVGPETGFRLTAAMAAAAWVPGMRALVVASPANPTGAVLSVDDLRALYALCEERGATLVVDEIYQGLTYGAPDHCALDLPEAGLMVVNSCSKYFGMTGWRVGWIVGPEVVAPVLERLAQNLFIAPSTVSQYAARAAFSTEVGVILEGRRRVFAERRAILLSGLADLGFTVGVEPAGAFYVYARLPDRIGQDSMVFASALLEGAGVAVVPGHDFGRHQAERYLRFAYTRDKRDLNEALGRLAAFSP